MTETIQPAADRAQLPHQPAAKPPDYQVGRTDAAVGAVADGDLEMAGTRTARAPRQRHEWIVRARVGSDGSLAMRQSSAFVARVVYSGWMVRQG